MANLSDIRDGIAANLVTAGILAYPNARDSVVPPEAHVGPPEIVEYDYTAGRGVDRWLVPVRLYVSKAEEDTAQDDLDEYIDGSGGLSVKAAIEADATLGSMSPVPLGVRVLTASKYGEYPVGGSKYLGVEFLVEVIV